METFFKTLKAEELSRNNYRSEREFRAHVQACIEFNNSKRPHQINRYRTPDAKEESYYKHQRCGGNLIELWGRFARILQISHNF